jgi:hypothetical protein
MSKIQYSNILCNFELLLKNKMRKIYSYITKLSCEKRENRRVYMF